MFLSPHLLCITLNLLCPFCSHFSFLFFFVEFLKCSCLSYFRALVDTIRFCFNKVVCFLWLALPQFKLSLRFFGFFFLFLKKTFCLHEFNYFFFSSIIYVTIHLSQATVDSIMRDKMPKKGGRWWFSWRGRNNTIKEVNLELPWIFLLGFYTHQHTHTHTLHKPLAWNLWPVDSP